VPFTLVHAGKYRTEDKLKIQTIQKPKITQKKANNTKHSDTKLPWFSHLIRHLARKRGGLNPQRSRAHTGKHDHLHGTHITRPGIQPASTLHWHLNSWIH